MSCLVYHFLSLKIISVSVCDFSVTFVTFCLYFEDPSLLASFVEILLRAALPDFATLPNLNAVKFLARRDNLVINPTIGLLSSRAIQNIPNMLGYL